MRVDHSASGGMPTHAVTSSSPEVSGGIEDVRAADAGPDALTDVRAVVVDTRSERRQLTRYLLESSVPPLEIAEADSRAAAIDLVDRFHPDLVVLEIQMPLEEGLDTIAALRLISPGPRIVVCSFHRDASTIQGAVDRGADAYLIKPVSSADLRAALGPLPAEPALRHRGPAQRPVSPRPPATMPSRTTTAGPAASPLPTDNARPSTCRL